MEALALRVNGWLVPMAQKVREQSVEHARWLAFGIGAVGALGFAPLNLWPLLLIAFVLLIWLLDGTPSAREALWLGWCFGFGHMIVGLYWVGISFRYQANMPASAGVVAVLLLAAFMACYSAIAVGLVRRYWGVGPERIFLFVATWTLGEWLRGVLFTGFPWNLVGTAWLPVLPVAQAASVVGAYGLSALFIMMAGGLALLGDRNPRSFWYSGMIFSVLLAIGLAGAVRLVLDPPARSEPVQLHIIQANIGQDQKWDDETGRRNLQEHLVLTDKAVTERGPGIVIWPETAIPNLIEEEPTTRYLLSRHILAPGAIITGGLRVDREPDGTPIAARNSLFVVSPEGAVEATYDKHHLVPFGEYLPLRDILEGVGLARLAPGAVDFMPGPGAKTLVAPDVPPFSPMICYEAIFPGGGASKGQRPEWLLNISNDAWFGQSSGPYQHLASARLRAIEQGLPLVRSTPTGVSAIIDGYGRILASTSLGRQEILTGSLPPVLSATAYSFLGSNPTLLGLIFMVVYLAARQRKA